MAQLSLTPATQYVPKDGPRGDSIVMKAGPPHCPEALRLPPGPHCGTKVMALSPVVEHRERREAADWHTQPDSQVKE